MLFQAEQNMLTQDVSNSGKSGCSVFNYKQICFIRSEALQSNVTKNKKSLLAPFCLLQIDSLVRSWENS